MPTRGMNSDVHESRYCAGADEELLTPMQISAIDTLSDGLWIAELDGSIRYRNRAAEEMERMRWSRAQIAGTMHEVVFRQEVLARVDEWEVYAMECELHGHASDLTRVHSVDLRIRALRDGDDQPKALVLHGRDVSREWTREQALHDRHVELEAAYASLKHTQTQLLQSEKMASIGQLAAGVAHEINNPIGYVHSNLGTLQGYVASLLELLDAYEARCASMPEADGPLAAQIQSLRSAMDYSFMRVDLPQLVAESREGIGRVKRIVLDLRDFSHAGELDSDDWGVADVHSGLDSTLNIVWNELKYKAVLRKEYGDLPMIECMPSQLNQVFLNLLVNAGYAIRDQGEIAIRTSKTDDEICISISDNGVGIPADVLPRIFDPFFTTKPVGKGTGLGLSLSYGIIQKHNGRIEVESEVDVGTTFHIHLPVRHRA